MNAATPWTSDQDAGGAVAAAPRRRNPEFVVKFSKHCNLRCTYCYEFESLADTRRMSLAHLQSFFGNIKGYCVGNALKCQFIWHGGEPLLVKPAAYLEIGMRQREILGADVAYRNATQTNLTVLTDPTLEFLAGREFFNGLGVSVDPFGSERVDVRGRCRNDTVFDNMQRLRDRGVPFGAITVLTRMTLPMLRRNFTVFDALGIGFRALPFYLSASASQSDAHALSHQEIVGALTLLFDLWLCSQRAVPIDPLRDYMRFAVRRVLGRDRTYRDPWRDETIFIVNTNGDIWGEAGEYEVEAKYGNIFEQDLEEVLQSENRERECARAAQRLETYCTRCPHYGFCPGDYVIHATRQQRALLDQSGCLVRTVIDHMVARFDETGLTDRICAGTEPTVAEDEAEETAVPAA